MKMESVKVQRELKISPRLLVQVEEHLNTQNALLKNKDAITLKKAVKKNEMDIRKEKNL